MQVTVEDVSSVKKILHIEVPEKIVIRELDNAYKQLKKTAKVKGFRPGKTPRSVLERLFKKDVHGDV
ncbi:MAG: trigger factor family protein, partial [Desulfobacteraceae bacterium]|nr:trigger factor family protein [Desulfobacteraceae bacterium]